MNNVEYIDLISQPPTTRHVNGSLTPTDDPDGFCKSTPLVPTMDDVLHTSVASVIGYGIASMAAADDDMKATRQKSSKVYDRYDRSISTTDKVIR